MNQDITGRKRIEAALAESETRLRTILQSVPECVKLLAADGTLLEMNPAGLAMIEADSEAQVLGKNICKFVRPEHRAAFQELLARNYNGESGTLEFEITGMKGTRRWMETHATPLRDKTGRIIASLSVTRDITERKRDEEALRESEGRFRGLIEQSIAGILTLDQDRVAYANPRCIEIIGYTQQELVGRSILEFAEDGSRGHLAELIGRLTRGEVASVRDDFRIVRKDGVVVDVGAHAVRATYRGKPVIMAVVQDISEKKRAEEEGRRHVAQLETTFMSTVEVIMRLSDLRDPYTSGHERRVGEIALNIGTELEFDERRVGELVVAIGAELGFDKRRLEGLRVAGYLHDIGKFAIPLEILSKPGRLTAAEYALIQSHPQAGYDVLKAVEFPWPVAQVALQHHERMDGSGYPQGLKGDAILLEARIVAVADVVEAMSSHRPYRPAISIDKALAEIERGRGTAYDAAVADACLKLFREKDFVISET